MHEVCDCHRPRNASLSSTRENRYYYDQAHNVRLTLVVSFGKTHQKWARVACAQNPRPDVVVINQGHHYSYNNETDIGMLLDGTIPSLIRECHPNHKVDVIWRTTTPAVDATDSLLDRLIVARLSANVSNGWRVFDAAQHIVRNTQWVPSDVLRHVVYWDHTHFRAPINAGINHAFLFDLLGQRVLEGGLVRCVRPRVSGEWNDLRSSVGPGGVPPCFGA